MSYFSLEMAYADNKIKIQPVNFKIVKSSCNKMSPNTTLVMGSNKQRIDALVLPINLIPICSKATANTDTNNEMINVNPQAMGVKLIIKE